MAINNVGALEKPQMTKTIDKVLGVILFMFAWWRWDLFAEGKTEIGLVIFAFWFLT